LRAAGGFDIIMDDLPLRVAVALKVTAVRDPETTRIVVAMQLLAGAFSTPPDPGHAFAHRPHPVNWPFVRSSGIEFAVMPPEAVGDSMRCAAHRPVALESTGQGSTVADGYGASS